MSNATLGGARLPLAAILAASLACGGDLALPDPTGATLDLSIVGGNGQTGTVGQALPEPLVVRVLADGGQPVAGRRVAFVVQTEGAGSLEPDTTETDNQGRAVATWVLGTVPGEQSVQARLVAELDQPPTADFQASAVAAGPDTLRALSPLNQPGRRGDTLDDPLVVVVVDRFGNPVRGVTVEWDVTVGEGNVSEDETTSGSDGTTFVYWELGGRIGVQKVTATVEGVNGSPVTFSATVLF